MAGRVKASEIEAVKKLKYGIKRTNTGAVAMTGFATPLVGNGGPQSVAITAITALGKTGTLTAGTTTLKNSTTNINILKQGNIVFTQTTTGPGAQVWNVSLNNYNTLATKWTVSTGSLKALITTAGGATVTKVLATVTAPISASIAVPTITIGTWISAQTATPTTWVTAAKATPWTVAKIKFVHKLKIKCNAGTVSVVGDIGDFTINAITTGGTTWQHNDLTTIMCNGTL